MEFINAVKYTPKDALPRVMYFKNEFGKDWYEVRDKFNPKLLKVVVQPSGYICASEIENDRVCIYEGYSVYEVANVPVNFKPAEKYWYYKPSKGIYYNHDLAKQDYEVFRNKKFEEASGKIASYTRLANKGMQLYVGLTKLWEDYEVQVAQLVYPQAFPIKPE